MTLPSENQNTINPYAASHSRIRTRKERYGGLRRYLKTYMNKYEYSPEKEHMDFLEKERDFIKQREFEKRLGGFSGNYEKNLNTLNKIENDRVLETNPFKR